MKRNKHGINFDTGIPLTSDEDFKLLYLNTIPEKQQVLVDWLNSNNRVPVIVAGQIGTGKTTFISKAIRDTGTTTDITISFDTEIPFYESGAFWSVFLGKILEHAVNLGIDLSPFEFEKDFYIDKPFDMESLVDFLSKPADSIASYSKKRKAFLKVSKNIDAIKNITEIVINNIEEKQNKPLSVFAEGVDKFAIHRSDFFSLLPLLNFLSKYKTLYESNLIHMFGSFEDWQQKSLKIVINNVSHNNVFQILTKRLGVYAASRQDILPVLSELSGGNVRQGLRLLMEYDYAIGKLKKNSVNSVNYASQRVRNDFLNITSGKISPELLDVINKDKFIKSGIITGLSEGEDAKNAIYCNWILIQDEPDDEQKWPVLINPLLLPALSSIEKIPDSPETKILKKWAEQHEVSPFGLEIDAFEYQLDKKESGKIISKSIDHKLNFFSEINRLQYDHNTLNISEVFDSMASFIMNIDRKEKIIIAYENKKLVETANDYITGRSGCYKPLRFEKIILNADSSENMLVTMTESIDEEKFDAYSVFFINVLQKEQLQLLDKSRDYFINYKMIWWIEFDLLKKYLPYWTQLRQFFHISRLEEDVLSNITVQDIKNDLEILKYSTYEDGVEVFIEKLSAILSYLEKRK